MITDFLKRAAKIFWMLPGFLLWASFPPMGEKSDVVFALAALMWLSRQGDAKKSAKVWFFNGFFFWFATLSWMPAIVKNGGPWPLVVLGWGALSAYCAAYFAAFGYLSAKLWQWVNDPGEPWRKPARHPYLRRLLAIFLLEPLLWCGLELVRSRFGGGFSWNQLGVPLVNLGFGAPCALGGVYLVSAVVVLVNGTIAGVAERVMRRVKTKWAPVETLVPFLLVWGIYSAANGTAETNGTDGAEAEWKTLTVALVQRNFPCVFQRDDREDPVAAYSNLLANVAYVRPGLVLLSESAMCEFGAVDSPRAAAFADWVSRSVGGAAVLAGGGRYAEGREYNSAGLYQFSEPSTVELSDPSTFQLSNSSTVQLSIYDKVHLVPFGEFIPGDKWITALQKFAPVGSCTPGVPKLLHLAPQNQTPNNPNTDISLGVAICFEDTDSALMREAARQGADLLCFITNDSWFSRSIEAEQHAWQAVARAIETGLPVARVGNSGVTGTIAPDGRCSWLCDVRGRPLMDAQGAMCDRIPIRTGARTLTVYTRCGDAPLGSAFALFMLAMILVKYKNYYEKRRYLSL